MKERRQTPDGGALFQIFLDKKENGALSGGFTGKGVPERIPFSSLSRMVIMMEERMDLAQTLPQTLPGTCAENPDVELEVLFRQNYSWQGRFRRQGEGKYTPFRSVMELLILLEAALEQ